MSVSKSTSEGANSSSHCSLLVERRGGGKSVGGGGAGQQFWPKERTLSSLFSVRFPLFKYCRCTISNFWETHPN